MASVRDRVGFPLLLRNGNCKSLLLHTVQLLIAFSHYPPNADFSSFLTLDCHSCLNPFDPDLEVARPNHLTKISSYHGLQSLITWHLSILEPFLVHKRQYCLKLNRIFHFHLGEPSKTISRCISLAVNKTWSHLVSKSRMWFSCKRMLKRSDKGQASCCNISNGCSKVVINHVNNLPSS